MLLELGVSHSTVIKERSSKGETNQLTEHKMAPLFLPPPVNYSPISLARLPWHSTKGITFWDKLPQAKKSLGVNSGMLRCMTVQLVMSAVIY